ncbi:MAG: 2Fe-2S iron-sulfur cluster binding domain-containing protein [Alphaproteobacteria bacterium]|nr:2Fe-2S iron-sulfur cluster binding domain-containing protein [Alphaproteobacteria bacterium]
MIRLAVNGRDVAVAGPPAARLADVLRDQLGLMGTKIGCDAGDCGACTVLLDGAQVCACLVPIAQAEGASITTVEGLAANGTLATLQVAFERHGAAQCGICTPGMLMAASALLAVDPHPSKHAVADALGGVLCRCTGYQKIVEAVLHAASDIGLSAPAAGVAVGAAMPRVDGTAKVTGAEVFGGDAGPPAALWLRAVRSPHWRATFHIGDLVGLHRRHPGLVRVLTARDVPGHNSFGIYPHIKDQPVLADGHVRFRGEAVAALVGDRATIAAIRDEDMPITWKPEDPLHDPAAALAEGAPLLHADRPGNVLTRGRVARGDLVAAFAGAHALAEVSVRTTFVEHAYIEPEAGWARRVGDRIEVAACTQTPYMDRDEVARVLGLAPEAVRIIPTGIGGGFGGKLDVAVQPLIAVAAWVLDRPVRCTFTRPESMAATTKRHPASITARAAVDTLGRLTGFDFHGDFNTGAYASWGPTVADRVPIHATGPYVVGAVRATSRAIYTNLTPAGAFRGFGVPQAAVAHEALMDDLAAKLGQDALEFRLENALRVGDPTATGQRLSHSCGLAACLEALRPRWRALRSEAERSNRADGAIRYGVGVGCMWYGCGNTSMSNPSTMRVGLARDGRLTLYSGAVDIGQGSNTVLVQIVADALGVAASAFTLVAGDTDRTADAGKTSASRQTFVSGRAAELAGRDLRAKLLRLANAGDDADLAIDGGTVRVRDHAGSRHVDLSGMTADANGDVLTGEGRFDPPTTKLDGDGQGSPYATYAFAAQLAAVAVDVKLGTVRVERMVAAHDVGRAINPMLVEGQIHGGIAQGLGFALMEEFVPGKTENLHDYLIPTFGDMPAIESILIEDREPLGPYGAKGIGEPALIATAPAILGAIHHATGVRVTELPALPHRLRAALKAAGWA